MEIEPASLVITGKTIDEHAETIRLSLEKARRYLKTAMSGYVNAGYKLKVAKDELPHGEWIPLLERVGINRMTANRYIRLAEDVRILEMAKRNTMLQLTQGEFLKMTKLEDKEFFDVVDSADPSLRLKELTALPPSAPTPMAEVKQELKQTRQSLKKAQARIAELERELERLRLEKE